VIVKRPWVFLDIGNVIWDDSEGDAFSLATIHQELTVAGLQVSREDIHNAAATAVATYAPSLFRDVIWRFTMPDLGLYRQVRDRVYGAWDRLPDRRYRAWTRPLPGIGRALSELKMLGFGLALASNNSPRAQTRLDELNLLHLFDLQGVSETMGLSKPDRRFFSRLLTAAGAGATDAVMVGDRLDNDILPARLMGLKTIRVMRGSHLAQRSHDPLFAPDLVIDHPGEISRAVEKLFPPVHLRWGMR
jgi:FMN phosphatase YigB (HAD superfamily)